MTRPAKTVHPVHFDDFSGEQFERLVFAYHVRADRWHSIEWYGQVGSDLGRDILEITKGNSTSAQRICIQCVNQERLTLAKATRDIDKAVQAADKFDVFRIVCRSTVSAELRDTIKEHAKKRGIGQCDVWSGSEFEEFLRNNCESLLKRFVSGEEFPDSEPELVSLAGDRALSGWRPIAAIFILVMVLFAILPFWRRAPQANPDARHNDRVIRGASDDSIKAVTELATHLGLQHLDKETKAKEDADLRSRLRWEELLRGGWRTSFKQTMTLETIAATACLHDGRKIATAKWKRRAPTDDKKRLVNIVEIQHFDLDDPSKVIYRGEAMFDYFDGALVQEEAIDGTRLFSPFDRWPTTPPPSPAVFRPVNHSPMRLPY